MFFQSNFCQKCSFWAAVHDNDGTLKAMTMSNELNFAAFMTSNSDIPIFLLLLLCCFVRLCAYCFLAGVFRLIFFYYIQLTVHAFDRVPMVWHVVTIVKPLLLWYVHLCKNTHSNSAHGSYSHSAVLRIVWIQLYIDLTMINFRFEPNDIFISIQTKLRERHSNRPRNAINSINRKIENTKKIYEKTEIQLQLAIPFFFVPSFGPIGNRIIYIFMCSLFSRWSNGEINAFCFQWLFPSVLSRSEQN